MAVAPAASAAVTDSEPETLQKPTRPLSGYNLFFRDKRQELLEAQRAQGHAKGVGFANMAKTIAHQWNNIDPSAKRCYELQARREKVKYKKAVTAYKKFVRNKEKQMAKTKKPPPSPPLASAGAHQDTAEGEESKQESVFSGGASLMQQQQNPHSFFAGNNHSPTPPAPVLSAAAAPGSDESLHYPNGNEISGVPNHQSGGPYGAPTAPTSGGGGVIEQNQQHARMMMMMSATSLLVNQQQQQEQMAQLQQQSNHYPAGGGNVGGEGQVQDSSALYGNNMAAGQEQPQNPYMRNDLAGLQQQQQQQENNTSSSSSFSMVPNPNSISMLNRGINNLARRLEEEDCMDFVVGLFSSQQQQPPPPGSL
eukprot:CAMPEP_0172441970 /NCGR_PEP_ID=MMETSP1065-20121228/2463_1 /TAXON_ID=265537 /ORGANISM="Amphiprora paludosa, Strain CCMP125" /LENGTH=364 /DNA_ID=CAMNT_0013191609 /DNA_START=124 /DNA_END=1218 /DNA_ORIENTATION=+